MKSLDFLLNLFIPSTILLHLLVAPYTKVEESFNIQAIYDIVNWNPAYFPSVHRFDHIEFSGAVPRTFVGAAVVAALAKPFSYILSSKHWALHAQFIVRAILGLINAAALQACKHGLEKSFGKSVARWWVLLQGSQFHVMYYASRTLPNMFAFGLTTLAMREILPITGPASSEDNVKRLKRAIFLLVLAGVIFRSEVALLLLAHLIYPTFGFAGYHISLEDTIRTGIRSATAALAISIPIDSFFWQKPIWPELAGFYYNAIQGKSVEWGTSPFHEYLTSLLPRLLLNPVTIGLIVGGCFNPATANAASFFAIPSLLFVDIYSLQPHKEARFIIYIVPAFTAAASLYANYIWNRRSKSTLYALSSLAIVLSIIVSFAASTTMLLISSLNYPGGEALAQLHSLKSYESLERGLISVHMDVPSCMTGVTQFGQRQLVADHFWVYDKTEREEELLDPLFWSKFDYLLMAEPGKAIGAWEVVGTVYSYAGIEVLRPGQESVSEEPAEAAYAANNLTKEEGGEEVVLSSAEVQEVVEEGAGSTFMKKGRSWDDLKQSLRSENMTRPDIYMLVRDAVRLVTGGWWVGPRMAPTIRILKRA